MPQPTDTLVRMSGIIGHEVVLRLLERTTERPAPGYLFHGPDGVGKREAARWFASKLLASDISHLTSHPDYILLKREEAARGIPVEAVRDLVARMHLTSARGGRKIAVIEDAEALNEAGMNALLKAVEEPDGAATFVFVAEQPDRLPATLRSRLVSIAFGPVASDELRAWLCMQTQDADAIERAVSAARGRPGLAKRLLTDPERWAARQASARALLVAMRSEPIGRALAEIERVGKSLNAAPDPETAWRDLLDEAERLLPEILADDPACFSRLAHGLILAHRFAGGPLSPHLALEWALLEPYHEGDIPSFLHPSYL
ncbi:AAA family ATPase [Candidatus Uhrbacteria bacterium]|nr:MAG: AAA family ATPase [Candidatus Uhrbacteria bacterium]